LKSSRQTSDSHRKVWHTVGKIPKGKVATYGQVARVSKLTGHARLVGYALHNLPSGMDIPWQRVINHQGKISFPESSRAYKRQKELLEKEGVVFLKGKVDTSIYGWNK